MSRVFVITGPSGVGKGTLIRLLRERVPELELSVSATTRAPRPGEEDGVDYHFLSDEEFDRARRRRRVRRARRVRRPPLRDAALRARAPRRRGRAGGARDRGPGRAPGARGDARGRPDLHRAAVASRRCATRLVGRGHRRPRARSSGASRSRARSSAAAGEFHHRVVNDRLDERPSCTRSWRDRRRRAVQLHEAVISPRIDKLLESGLELRVRDRRRQARPADQQLLPQPRRGHVRRVPAADGRNRLEELPDDRARGGRRGQDQVPATARRASTWRASCSA